MFWIGCPWVEPAGIPAAEAAGWGAAAVQMLHSSLRRNSCPLVRAAPLLLSLCRAHLDGSPTMWGLEVKNSGGVDVESPLSDLQVLPLPCLLLGGL